MASRLVIFSMGLLLAIMSPSSTSAPDGYVDDLATASMFCAGTGDIYTCDQTDSTAFGYCWGSGKWFPSAKIFTYGNGHVRIDAVCGGSSVAGCDAYAVPNGIGECNGEGQSMEGKFLCDVVYDHMSRSEFEYDCADPPHPALVCELIEGIAALPVKRCTLEYDGILL